MCFFRPAQILQHLPSIRRVIGASLWRNGGENQKILAHINNVSVRLMYLICITHYRTPLLRYLTRPYCCALVYTGIIKAIFEGRNKSPVEVFFLGNTNNSNYYSTSSSCEKIERGDSSDRVTSWLYSNYTIIVRYSLEGKTRERHRTQRKTKKEVQQLLVHFRVTQWYSS